ncbi:crispr-associated protein, Csy1 family [Pseudomonas chlororaphis subsp. aurantiaca]|uniref:type I-F CRISPR-associated protein Csy1 n=1 Tax=Pseudomonas chlororaphis TaxID=587753 RepID=UPI00050D6F5A|nr:type I-F CRISPR-associated protein Csy1 [Pseudomonas chlororaphis]AIS11306.1 crispr-associated protein, Csy1 family [Pseudomonas chlororaphis subsp. aurantiaca]
MNNESDPTPRSTLFHSAITAFIHERRETKLKGGDAGADAQTVAKYDYGTWLADAARRVSQIQAVTHVLKANHPDARGSSLHVTPSALPQHSEVGTHVLADDCADDVVGNAAALDVYKFLKLEVEACRLLDWLLKDDQDLLRALHPDPSTAQEWASAFKGLIRPAERWSSHGLAKQIYWSVSGEPSDDTGFHLLQPLFSSSLAHAAHAEINDARFGESNKATRQAKRNNVPHDEPYRDYRNLVIRKLGGTKPQNISQLNSERGGVNYLLASLPPQWQQTQPGHFLSVPSVFERFRQFEGVNELIQGLCALLESDPPKTLPTRLQRERLERGRRLEQGLGHALAAFGLTSRERLEPGWSRNSDCQLPLCEQLWLDPLRSELPLREDYLEDDRAFVIAFELKDWPDQVAHRFGNWLNAILQQRGLPVGDVEHAHWAKQALIDAEWPAPMQRRARPADNGQETIHD